MDMLIISFRLVADGVFMMWYRAVRGYIEGFYWQQEKKFASFRTDAMGQFFNGKAFTTQKTADQWQIVA